MTYGDFRADCAAKWTRVCHVAFRCCPSGNAFVTKHWRGETIRARFKKKRFRTELLKCYCIFFHTPIRFYHNKFGAL